jgi:hypothetical protein
MGHCIFKPNPPLEDIHFLVPPPSPGISTYFKWIFSLPCGISADFYWILVMPMEFPQIFYELLTHPMEIPWQVLEILYWFFN